MSALHLIRLPISLDQLGRWAAQRKYGFTLRRGPKGQGRDAGFDEGRAIHHLLAETFGPGILQPFRHFVAPGGKQSQVYAYSRLDADALRDAASSYALPEASTICDLTQLAAKAMPEQWRAGRRLGFEIRVRPVSRLLKPLPAADGTFAKGAEVDVFLLEAIHNFPTGEAAEASMLKAGRSREAVYKDWLARRLKGGATLQPGVRLTRFQRLRAARKNYSPEGPDAVFQGDLIVDDPVGFQELLSQGIGRHKAYGYGMLLLRPPRSRF
jgi:CRISPR system Cascade subunit CasE